MISVSSKFIEAVNASMRNIVGKLEIYFDGENNSPEVFEEDKIMDMRILEEASADSSNPLGVVSSNELTLTLANPGGIFTPSNVNSAYHDKIQHSILVKPYIGAEVSPGEFEYVPMGKFWTDDWDSPGDAVQTNVTAYDLLYTLGQQDTPYIRVIVGQDIKVLFRALFVALGLTDNDFIIDPAISCKLPYAWLASNTVKETLRNLCTVGNCTVSMTRDGKIYVRSNVTNNNIVLTVSDTNQIVTAKNVQTYNSLENVVNLTYNFIQKSDVQSLLELDNFDTIAGITSVTNVSFQSTPVLRVQDIQISGSANDTASIINFKYDSEQISFDIQNTVAETLKIVVMGVYLVTNNSVLTVQDDDLVKEMGKLPLNLTADLIQKPDIAKDTANDILRIVGRKNAKYQLALRGNPALEILDSIVICDPTEKIYNATVAIHRQEFEWAGSLNVEMEAYILVGTVVPMAMRRLVVLPYSIHEDTKRRTALLNAINEDLRRVVVIPNTLHEDTRRTVIEVLTVAMDTLRKVKGSIVTFDALRFVVNRATKDIDTKRIVHATNNVTVDTIRKLNVLLHLDSDTKRQILNSNNIDIDTKRFVHALDSVSIDTRRKVAIVAGRFDVARKVVNLNDVVNDSKRKVSTNVPVGVDTKRLADQSSLVDMDAIRKLVEGNTIDSDTKRKIAALESVNIDTKREVQKAAAADYVVQTDGSTGLVKFENLFKTANFPHSMSLFAYVKILNTNTSNTYRIAGTYNIFSLEIDADKWHPFIMLNGDAYYPSSPTGPVPRNQWVKVALIFNGVGSPEPVQFFVDDTLNYSANSYTTHLPMNDSNASQTRLSIGGLYSSSILTPLALEIADLQVYNVAKDGTKYPMSVNEDDSNLVLHCKFNADSGDEVNKATSHPELTGVLTTGATRIEDATRPIIGTAENISNTIACDTNRDIINGDNSNPTVGDTIKMSAAINNVSDSCSTKLVTDNKLNISDSVNIGVLSPTVEDVVSIHQKGILRVNVTDSIVPDTSVSPSVQEAITTRKPNVTLVETVDSVNPTSNQMSVVDNPTIAKS